ncbi:MAG: hypothetical protein VB062_04585 [Christensenella sp.]|nr:hypothetical protein [Christensenella sp.]
MEKIIKIDGKDVGFKCPASFPIRYKALCGRDFFADTARLGAVKDDVMQLDSQIIYDMTHCMARCYDPKIPADPADWVDSFESFSVFEVFGDLQDIINSSIGSGDEKNLKAAE